MIWKAEVSVYELDTMVKRAQRDNLPIIVTANVGDEDAQITVGSPTPYGGAYVLHTERPERIN
jgi:hypothetical protein